MIQSNEADDCATSVFFFIWATGLQAPPLMPCFRKAARCASDKCTWPMPFANASAFLAFFAAHAIAAHLGIPQGVYEDCAPADGEARCLARLHQIAAGGFTLVVDYSQFYGSSGSEVDYARTASALGLR